MKKLNNYCQYRLTCLISENVLTPSDLFLVTCSGKPPEDPGQIMKGTVAYLNRPPSYNVITKIGCKWL